nr:MAG TPA: hypothetical protein [Caudoviricetes sp.]
MEAYKRLCKTARQIHGVLFTIRALWEPYERVFGFIALLVHEYRLPIYQAKQRPSTC